jgi:hypothetical protein
MKSPPREYTGECYIRVLQADLKVRLYVLDLKVRLYVRL